MESLYENDITSCWSLASWERDHPKCIIILGLNPASVQRTFLVKNLSFENKSLANKSWRQSGTGFGSSDLKFTKPKSSPCWVNFPPSLSHHQSIILVARIFSNWYHLSPPPPLSNHVTLQIPFHLHLPPQIKAHQQLHHQFQDFQGILLLSMGRLPEVPQKNQGNHNGFSNKHEASTDHSGCSVDVQLWMLSFSAALLPSLLSSAWGATNHCF